MAKNIPTYGIAIDWETSGYSVPDYASKHQGISVGAAVFDIKTFEPIETFYQVIRFNKNGSVIYDKTATSCAG
jgi:pyruvate-formate lyase-activating enzyme